MKLLKIVKTILVSLVVIVLVSLVGIIIFLKTYNLNHLKPQIIQSIKKYSSLNVGIEKIAFDFSLEEGITLNLKHFVIKDAAVYLNKYLFESQRIVFQIELLPFLLRQEIVSSEVTFDSPQLRLIVDDQGSLNIQRMIERVSASFAKPPRTQVAQKSIDPLNQSEPKEVDASRADNISEQSLASEDESNTQVLPKVRINSFKIKDGAVIYSDKIQSPEITVPIKDINVHVSNFSLDETFQFSVSSSLWSDNENIKIQGEAICNVPTQQVRLDDVLIVTDFDQLSLIEIQKDVRVLSTDKVKSIKEGKVSILINQLVVGAQGVLVLSADGSLSDMRFDFVNNQFPINTTNAKWEITEDSIILKEFLSKLGSGEIHLAGNVQDYVQTQDYDFDLTLKGLKVEEFLSVEEVGYDMRGVFEGDLHIEGLSLDPDTFGMNMKGKGKFNVREALIKDVNLLKMAIDKIPNISNVQERIENNLPERLKEKLKEQDTQFEKVFFDFSLSQASLFLKNGEVATAEFSTYLNGEVDLTQKALIRSNLYIGKDFSQSLVEAVGEFSCLLDESQERIFIPMIDYQGPISKARIYPDVRDLLSRVGKCRLRDVIKDAIGGSVDSSSATSKDSVLVPVFDGKEIPVDVDPIIDKALDIFNDIF